MSGIFLTVWDDAQNDAVLAFTKGGWPHITIAYTGSGARDIVLAKCAFDILQLELGAPLELVSAFVNSFEKSNGVMRHDVLVSVSDPDRFERYRAYAIDELDCVKGNREYEPCVYPKSTVPHVTVAICNTLEEATRRAEEVNKLLPRKIRVTGFTID